MGDTPITVRGGKLTVYARDGQTLSSEVRGVNNVEPILTTVQRAYQIVTNVSMKVSARTRDSHPILLSRPVAMRGAR